MADKRKEKVFKQGMADPRSGPERVAAVVNRVLSGNRKAAVRRYDDNPTVMAINKKKKKSK